MTPDEVVPPLRYRSSTRSAVFLLEGRLMKIHTGSQRIVFMWAMFSLALCALIGGIALIAAASYRETIFATSGTECVQPRWRRNRLRLATPAG